MRLGFATLRVGSTKAPPLSGMVAVLAAAPEETSTITTSSRHGCASTPCLALLIRHLLPAVVHRSSGSGKLTDSTGQTRLS